MGSPLLLERTPNMTSRFPASLRIIGRSFVDWWDGWLDMVLITSVWFLAQVTVILGPPATFGAYYAIHSALNGESLGIRGLIAGAKKYFGKALLWGLINILTIVILYVNYIFYGGFQTNWSFVVQGFVIFLGVLYFCTQFYALPYFIEMGGLSLKLAMRNGILTTLAAPFFTIIIFVLVAILLVVSIGFVIPVFLGLPAMVSVLGFRAMYNRLEVFGLRQREKTPKEIELEESGKIFVPGFGERDGDTPSDKAASDIEEDIR